MGNPMDDMMQNSVEDLILYSRTTPEKRAVYADFPQTLLPEIRDYLRGEGIEQLYCHQAEMFELAQGGQNVVITTSTASGKTLGFLLPVLQEILTHPGSRAIFLYPTKALANDQYRALRPYIEYFGEERLSAGVYDGDTPTDQRSRIRRRANIILTNPEMLNASFLPNHSRFGFDQLFSDLKYVVIDELHTYRGAFGSHLANVFRRFARVCRYYHAQPQFLCSSATIANPVELAEGICGQQLVRVSRDGAPAPEKTYLFVQPPKLKDRDGREIGQTAASTVAAGLLPDLVWRKIGFIAFARTRRSVEVVLKETRDRLAGDYRNGRQLAEQISGYRGGYTPRERQEIERRMTNGSLTGLVATNALELGIDIGRVDTTVLVGYPGTKASFWQQTGRAGRSGQTAVNYLILQEQPFDQYIAVNPGWLFDGGSESAVIDKNNLLIELAHIRAAAAEIPLSGADMQLFPDLGEAIPALLEAGELTRQGDKFVWSGESYPSGDYSLRNIDNNRYQLILQETKRVITEMEELQAYRELHTGAIYMHDGSLYRVNRLDRETRTAYGEEFHGNYYTIPGGNTEIRVLQRMQESDYRNTHLTFGDVHVYDSVTMFKRLQFLDHQNLGFEQLPEPLSKEFDTESAWVRLPGHVVQVYRRLLQETRNGMVVKNNHFEGICYALENAALMTTMTEREDIGVVVSQNALGSQDSAEDQVVLYLYDKFIGGLGYAEKAYERMPDIIEQAITMVRGCSCENGCVACIGDYRLDRRMVLWGLESLLEEQPLPAGMRLSEGGQPEQEEQEPDIPFPQHFSTDPVVQEKLQKRLEHLNGKSRDNKAGEDG